MLINNKNVLLQVLEAGSPSSRVWQMGVWQGPSLWYTGSCLFAVSSRGKGGEGAL